MINVNVELFADFDPDDEGTKAKNKKCRDNWKFGSISTDGIVIPISITNKKTSQV